MPKDEYDEDDPFELIAVPLPGGDVDYMAECFVDEFVRMGYDDVRLRQLFISPLYSATHAIYLEKGERYVQDLIDRVRAKWGFFRFNPAEEPDTDDGAPSASPFIQIEGVSDDAGCL